MEQKDKEWTKPEKRARDNAFGRKTQQRSLQRGGCHGDATVGGCVGAQTKTEDFVQKPACVYVCAGRGNRMAGGGGKAKATIDSKKGRQRGGRGGGGIGVGVGARRPTHLQHIIWCTSAETTRCRPNNKVNHDMGHEQHRRKSEGECVSERRERERERERKETLKERND